MMEKNPLAMFGINSLILFAILASSVAERLQASFEPPHLNKETIEDKNGVPWGESYNVTMTLRHMRQNDLSNTTKHVTMILACLHEEICSVNNGNEIEVDLDGGNNFKVSMIVEIEALFLGKTFLVAKNVTVNNNNSVELDFLPFEVVVLRSDYALKLNTIFTAFIIVFVTVNTFMMGTQLHLKVIWRVLKKPIGPAIGFFSQYLLMPVFAFSYSKLFLNGYPNLQFGLFAYGCSPGGGNSNFWTLLLEGNLDLSVTMTFVSNCAALFMMPLWLYTVGSTFYHNNAVFENSTPHLPWTNIVISLFGLLIPVLFGILFGHWKPHMIPKMRKAVKWFTLVLIAFIMVFSSYANWYIFLLIRWYTLVPGFLLPISGYSCAYLIALIVRQRYREARTIAIETGIQNAGVAIVICQMSLPQPESDMTIVMPVCCLIFTGLPLWTWLLGRTIAKKYCGYIDKDVADDEAKESKHKQQQSGEERPTEVITDFITKHSNNVNAV